VQELSYNPRDPVVEFGGWRLSLQIVTSENLYGIGHPTVDGEDTSAVVRAASLTWAGGQQTTAGAATITLRTVEGGTEAVIEASAHETIRCTKLIVNGLPDGTLLGHRWQSEAIRQSGTTVHYPATTHTPLIFLALDDGEHLYFESLDDRVRAKRFTVVKRDGGVAVELIHEDAAPEMSTTTTTASWRLGRTRDPQAIAARHAAHAARCFHIEPWESRGDVPQWMRGVSLVLALHGMHWSGYAFNTYGDMLGALEYVCERIDGRRVLAFLPGWEGRYYWQYGDYRPEPRLGGTPAFARLAARARELGAHLMPMFGANCVNRNVAGFETWGAPAELRSPSGLAFQGNRPDWDTSRAHDPGWQMWLNPGVRSWRERLVDQVSTLVGLHSIPAVFFDTQQVWINDAQAGVYEGLVALRDELKSRFPELLVAGEGWYDALGAVTPLSQSLGHLPARWEETFARHNRCFMHLATGDPSRGSTGVHELGFSPFAVSPDVPHMIPTMTVVDGTMTEGRAGVDQVISQARRYAASL
jgi:hypothetical protein